MSEITPEPIKPKIKSKKPLYASLSPTLIAFVLLAVLLVSSVGYIYKQSFEIGNLRNELAKYKQGGLTISVEQFKVIINESLENEQTKGYILTQLLDKGIVQTAPQPNPFDLPGLPETKEETPAPPDQPNQ